MREQAEYSDVTLISQEGERFQAHRLILGVTSAFLQSKMRRSSGKEILMKTVKTEVLSALLNFIYEGDVRRRHLGGRHRALHRDGPEVEYPPVSPSEEEEERSRKDHQA